VSARGLGAALLALALMLGAGTLPATAAGTSPSATDADRARSAYAGMQNHFYLPQAALYRGNYPPQPNDRTYSYHWPFSQAMAATLDVAALSGTDQSAVSARLTGLAAYWNGGAGLPAYDSYVVADGGGDRFYDDNAWSGLDLLRVYQATGSADALNRAEQVFTYARSGWATTQVCSGSAGTGGIFWRQQPANPPLLDRNTVSTAPNAELGLALYLATKNTDPNAATTYLKPSSQMYDWVNSHLRDPADGLYWDHVYVATDGSCAVEQTKWSYNQGTMIGAGLLLYEATGQLAYLTYAEQTAAAALTRYGFDPVTSSFAGTGAIFGQGSPFNAIFFRNLLLLALVDTANGSYRRAMQAYADAVWDNTAVRQTEQTGTLFYFPGDGNPTSGPPLSYVDLTRQAAMVEIYAGLAYAATTLPSAPRADPGTTSPDWLYFPQTQHFLSFGFKEFWLASGGLPVFGYPLTEEFTELNPDTGATYTVQYLERQRFEYHPDLAGTPYAVELGRLGAEDARARGLLTTAAFQPLPPGTPPTRDCEFVAVTGHRLCAGFRIYWHDQGLDLGDPGISTRESLALFGYPISEEFVDPATGVTTQYFERAVFEYHPNNPDPYTVELRRLGADVLTARGW